MSRQTGPCRSSWMSSGTTLVYPTSLFLVLVCVLDTPDNEVTWWSVASVAGRERKAKKHATQCAFCQILLCLQPCSCFHLSTQRTPSHKPPPGLSAHEAPMHIHKSGLCCREHGKKWYGPRPGLCLICVAPGQQSYASFPRLSRLLEATEMNHETAEITVGSLSKAIEQRPHSNPRGTAEGNFGQATEFQDGFIHRR